MIVLLIPVFLLAQKNRIVFKLKENTPEQIFNSLLKGNLKSGNATFSKTISSAQIIVASQLFSSNKFRNSKLAGTRLEKIFIAESSLDARISALILRTSEYIEYAEVPTIRKLEKENFTPNDPYFNLQYHHSLIKTPTCWNNTLGDSSIIIGVVDSGLDFLHPDLINSFAINNGEYGNGKENNGIDDDGDGYTDNWRGWNFVNNSNDPSDDNLYSHGTAVTGIISAGFNNGIGISSISPKSKVLVLKAFNINGLGEDDKVAEAILYGIVQGVRIFNFSFGDYEYSYLLRDVIRYANSKGITIVCSAGNDGTDRLHYPSAFDEVISVGASTSTDSKASFSCYGETVDIFAPGSIILTTSIRGKGDNEFGKDYLYSSGTSFSAPIVSAVAALVLSKNVNLRNEELRGILTCAADYFPSQTGWNHTYSSGRLNAYKSITDYDKPSISRIYFPYQNFSAVNTQIPLFVSAASSYFKSYNIFYGVGESPSSFISISGEKNYQTLNDTIGFWDISGFTDTTYTLRLSVNTIFGKTIEHRQIIKKDESRPEITGYYSEDLLFENGHTTAFVFNTNKPTLGIIFYKIQGAVQWDYIYAGAGISNNGFISKSHYALLNNKSLIENSRYQYYIKVISENGLADSTGIQTFDTYTEISEYNILSKPYTLPYSQTCNTINDITGNSRKEVFLNLIKNNLQLELFEFTGTEFNKISNGNWNQLFVARDVLKLPDSKSLLLTNKGRNGFVYSSQSPNTLPTQILWSDESSDNFWSSRFADSDRDGIPEIIGCGKSGLRILEFTGSGFIETAVLPFTVSNAESNSQAVLVNDYDNDGKNEIIFSSGFYQHDGTRASEIDIYRCNSNNNYTKVNSIILEKSIKGENITDADIDGNGIKEIIIGAESSETEVIPIYTVFVFKLENGNLNIVSEKSIYSSLQGLQVSTKKGDLDGNAADEILINYGKFFYILKYINQTLRADYCIRGINTYTQLIYDFDGNGIPEIGLNSINDTTLFFEMNINPQRPQIPLSLRGYSSDSNRVNLQFNEVAGASYYKIYRSTVDSIQYFVLTDSSQTNSYSDFFVNNRTNYYYKVSAVNMTMPIKESELSSSINIYVHNKSKLQTVESQPGGFLLLKFTEKISRILPTVSAFVLNNGENPLSVSVNSDFTYLLSFKNKLRQGSNSIKTINLKDYYNSPIDTNLINFNAAESDSSIFYIKTAEIIGTNKIKIEFSTPVDKISGLDVRNYNLSPFHFIIASAEADITNPAVVYLNVSGSGSIGASGKNYLLKVTNVLSSNGVNITTGTGSTFSFIFTKETLENAVVYPNPYSSKSGNAFITFANLTQTAVIYIYGISGNFINKIEETDGNGGIEWDLKDINGKEIPSGIYIFRAEGKNSNGRDVEEKIGKFAVIR